MNLVVTKKPIASFIRLNKLHFFIILMCVLMKTFNLGEPYRFFAHLNLIIVLISLPSLLGSNNFDKRQLLYVLAIPVIFIALHYVTTMQMEYVKEVWKIILATSLTLGIWMLARNNHDYVKKNIFKFTLGILFFYVAVQSVALLLLEKPYGSLTNPHYLAFYSATFFLIAIYSFLKMSANLKWLVAISIVILGAFILHSSSRPTWIGLIFSGMLMLLFLEPKLRKLVAVIFALVLIGLILTNAGNFAGRFEDLLVNISTEERVVIWQDTWHMQMDSSIKQWVLGHGLNSFEDGFKLYSHYHSQQQIDFNSPHNFILEVLYLSGLVGVVLLLTLVFVIYKSIFNNIKNNAEYKNISLLLLVIFTTNFIAVGITVTFISIHNLNVIAVVAGIILFLRESSKQDAICHYL